MAEPPIYCIDTSSILEWYVRTYPPAIFESLPPRMEALIEEGRLRAPKVVFDEIRPATIATTGRRRRPTCLSRSRSRCKGWYSRSWPCIATQQSP